MKNKYLILILNILVFGYLFYLLNPLFAAKGHWFSWQGTCLTALVALTSVLLEVGGIWKRLGDLFLGKRSSR